MFYVGNPVSETRYPWKGKALKILHLSFDGLPLYAEVEEGTGYQ